MCGVDDAAGAGEMYHQSGDLAGVIQVLVGAAVVWIGRVGPPVGAAVACPRDAAVGRGHEQGIRLTLVRAAPRRAAGGVLGVVVAGVGSIRDEAALPAVISGPVLNFTRL